MLLDAVIGRQTADPHLFDVVLAQERGEFGSVKGGIVVLVARAFRHDMNARVIVQITVKLRAARVLYAVRRPRPAVLGEMFCFGGMPVAAFDDKVVLREKFFDQTVERSDHFVATRDGQRAFRTEIVLHVNHDERAFFFVRHDTGRVLQKSLASCAASPLETGGRSGKVAGGRLNYAPA